MSARVPCVHVSQVCGLHEVYLLLDTDEAAAALQLRESLDTLHQGEAGQASYQYLTYLSIKM